MAFILITMFWERVMVAKTKEELMKEWNDHAKKVRVEFEKQYNDKIRKEARDYDNAVVKPQAQLQKAKDAKDPYEADGKKTYWELVKHEAHKLINDNFAGYNDWAIAMSGLVHIAMLLSKANWYDRPEITNLIPYSREIGGVFSSGWEGAKHELADLYNEYLDVGWVDKDKLPGVGYTASLDAQGQLEVKVTIDGNPDPDPRGQLKNALDVGTVAWAKSRGYDLVPGPQPGTKVFKDADGNQMTHEKFVELNNDSDLGLNNFVKGGFIPAELTMGPRP